MTATAAPDTSRPGWLRRAWEQHLAGDPPRRGADPEEVDHLLASAIPDILEPFVDWDIGNPGMDEAKTLWLRGIDAVAATALLEHEPLAAAFTGLSSFAPAPATLLRVVAASEGVTCGGDVTSPWASQAGLRIWSLDVRDPALLDVEPDVRPAGIPAWLDALPGEAYADYLEDRQTCLDHGRTRAAWMQVAARHGIRDGRKFPVTEITTDALTGEQGVRFLW